MNAGGMVPHDQALPDLALAFDCRRMGRILQQVIDPSGEAGIRVIDCSIARSKYRPGRNCMVLYRASISDGRGGPPVEQWFSCGIYAGREAMARYQAGRAAPLVRPRFGPPLAHVPAHKLVIWAYPNERKLHALPLLADDARLIDELLSEVVEAAWGARRPIGSIRTRIAGYFPEHACCIRVSIRFCDRREAADWVVFGKTRFDDGGADTLAAMRALRQSDAHRQRRLGIARPLCYQGAHRLIWQEGVPGQTLESLLASGACAQPLLSRLGEALGHLHGIGLPGLRAVGTADVLARLDESAWRLGLAVPPLAARLQRLARELAGEAMADEPAGNLTLHGDLHLNNVLAAGDALYFVDFDSLRQGPAALELGSFVAALDYRGALHRVPDQAVRAATAGFLSAYQAASGRRVPGRHIAWYRACALLGERMSRCLTSLKPGRFELIEGLLARAEALCAGEAAAAPRGLLA